MKQIQFATAIATFITASAPVAAALPGSDLLLEHRFELRNDASALVNVVDGPSDIANLYLGNNSDGPVGYYVDVDSNSISIDFYIKYSSQFSSVGIVIPGPPYMNGLLLTGPALDAPAFKASAVIFTGDFQFTQDRIVVYGAHQVGLDFNSLEFNGNSYLQVGFSQPTAVPEPSTLFLMLLGLASFGVFRRQCT